MPAFLNRDPGRHRGISPLAALYIGHVSQFWLDYVHLVLLGVIRRLMYWDAGETHGGIDFHNMKLLSDKVVVLKKHIPTDFARKGCPVGEWKKWKATEWR